MRLTYWAAEMKLLKLMNNVTKPVKLHFEKEWKFYDFPSGVRQCLKNFQRNL